MLVIHVFSLSVLLCYGIVSLSILLENQFLFCFCSLAFLFSILVHFPCNEKPLKSLPVDAALDNHTVFLLTERLILAALSDSSFPHLIWFLIDWIYYWHVHISVFNNWYLVHACIHLVKTQKWPSLGENLYTRVQKLDGREGELCLLSAPHTGLFHVPRAVDDVTEPGTQLLHHDP